MLTILAKTLKVLNSEVSPWQIGWAIALGLMAGLMPFGLLTIVILLIVCFFTVNLTTFILVWGLSKAVMLFLAPGLEAFTWEYARQPGLLSLLSSTESLQALHLHHTLVLGSFVLGLIMLVPVAWIGSFLVKQYRATLMQKLEKWRVVQVVKASKLYQIYEHLS